MNDRQVKISDNFQNFYYLLAVVFILFLVVTYIIRKILGRKDQEDDDNNDNQSRAKLNNIINIIVPMLIGVCAIGAIYYLYSSKTDNTTDNISDNIKDQNQIKNLDDDQFFTIKMGDSYLNISKNGDLITDQNFNQTIWCIKDQKIYGLNVNQNPEIDSIEQYQQGEFVPNNSVVLNYVKDGNNLKIIKGKKELKIKNGTASWDKTGTEFQFNYVGLVKNNSQSPATVLY